MSTERSHVWMVVGIVLAILALAGGATLALNARRSSMIAMRTRVLVLGNDIVVRTLMDEPLGVIAESVGAEGKVEGMGYAMLGSGGKIILSDGVRQGSRVRLRFATRADIVGIDGLGVREVVVRRDASGISGGSESARMYAFDGAFNETSFDHPGGRLSLWIEKVGGRLALREGER